MAEYNHHHHHHGDGETEPPVPTITVISPDTIFSTPTTTVPTTAAVAAGGTVDVTTSHELYFQQTTTSMLISTITISILGSLACLILFSWVRTKRTSIYGSRQFFTREENRAEALPTGFFGWVRGLMYLERDLVLQQQREQQEKDQQEQQTRADNNEKHQHLSSTDSTTAPPPPRTITTLILGKIWKRHGAAGQGHDNEKTDHQSGSTTLSPFHGSKAAAAAARQVLIAKIGLDHYLLIRFLWLLFALSAIVCIPAFLVLAPLYTVAQSGEDADGSSSPSTPPRIEKMQIGNVTDNERLWATVIATAVVSAAILFGTWSELMMYLKLRKSFLYRCASRYSSRTVLLQHIPTEYRSVEALNLLFSTAPGGGVEHVYLIRDTTSLEVAIQRRQVVLDKLEDAESNYMEAIARASALVCTTALSMRSRSWLGRTFDRLKQCFGQVAPGSETFNIGGGGGRGGNPDEEEYVGPLKMYQLDDMVKISHTDLSDHQGSSANNSSLGFGESGAENNRSSSSPPANAALNVLKWYQKPRRPRHYVGLPLVSKRIDSIRYYRGELCRLNKVITQAYEDQAAAMAADLPHGYQRPGQQQTQEKPTAAASTSQVALTSQINVLPSAFILMKTHAGAKSIATGDIGVDKIPLSSRTLGIAPRDIEWRVLSQERSKPWHMFTKAMILTSGTLSLVICGFMVAAISSMAVFDGWARVPQIDAIKSAQTSVYLRQGILAPLLLTVVMSTASWIFNELCQYWGCVSKTQAELLTQRCYLVFLMINILLVHPLQSLSVSWKESAMMNSDNPLGFLIHAIPSYSSYAFGYVLVSGLALPFYQLLQPGRLWATLPVATLWSILGPLSWRKMTRSRQSGSSSKTSSPQQGTSPSEGANIKRVSTISSCSSVDSGFDANFTSAPTQTPRQAFLIRQPPFFDLQTLYPHLVVLFTLSLALFPLTPILFLLWPIVLVGVNLCYRYLVLQVVTTKSQSGGQHFKQALMFILYPTVTCPPLLLAVYLGARNAWIHCGFMSMITVLLMAVQITVGLQFKKKEQMMLHKVEKYHGQQSKSRMTTTNKNGGGGGGGGGATSSFLGSTTDLLQSTTSFDDLENDAVSPLPPGYYYDEKSKMKQRPTTMFGQVRSSIVSSISGGPKSRPKSVAVFDLARYEADIVGKKNGRGGLQNSKDPNDPNDQEGDNNDDDDNGAGVDPNKFGTGQDFDSWAQQWSPPRPAAASTIRMSVLSEKEEEEEERQAKYRDIVKALRRASTIVSKKGSSDPSTSNAGDTGAQQQQQTRRGNRNRGDTNMTSSSVKSKYRVSMPAPSVTRTRPLHHGNNPYLIHQPSSNCFQEGGFSSVTTSTVSLPTDQQHPDYSLGHSHNRGHGGAPSLPILLMHRETVVAAKKKSRVRNLYLNPVFQDAKTRVIVWLPSQTEASFWGEKYGQAGAKGLFERCKYHAALDKHHAALAAAAATSTTAAAPATAEGNDLTILSNMGSTDLLGAHRSGFGMSCSTIETPLIQSSIQQQQQQQQQQHVGDGGSSRHVCRCHLFRAVAKAVANAVALADQEIRDLRTVGLAVWLDSRHVVWGQEKEEDGRLGDRYMMISMPSTFGGGEEVDPQQQQHDQQQRHVGDGLLSWLDTDNNGENVTDEELQQQQFRQGQGAPGVIGGSMGVIMKRPIGYYGKLVGDGVEDDDVSRG